MSCSAMSLIAFVTDARVALAAALTSVHLRREATPSVSQEWLATPSVFAGVADSVPAMAHIICADPRAQALLQRASAIELPFDLQQLMMDLPTDSGHMLLDAWSAAGPAATTTFFKHLVRRRWQALFDNLAKKHDAIRYLAGWRLDMPDDLRAMASEYNENYYRMACNRPCKDLAKAWRSGTATACGAFEVYPDGRPGQRAPPPKKSKRMNASYDKVLPGELYPAPNDEIMRSLQELEVPGFLAGTSYKLDVGDADLPNLTLLHPESDSTNYTWLPLARRVDIDRVYRAVEQSGFFETVVPCGSLNMPLKINPWSHMSPYKVAVSGATTFLQQQRLKHTEIGVTDEGGTGRVSTTGARLYVMGPPETKNAVLLRVASLLLESDFDPGFLKVTLKGTPKDGRRVVDWGRSCTSVDRELMLTDLDKEPRDVQKERLRQAAVLAEQAWPLNSEVRTQLAAKVAVWTFEQEELDWKMDLQKSIDEAQKQASVSQPAEPAEDQNGWSPTSPAAEDDEQEQPDNPYNILMCDEACHPPAPGWHDPQMFPELATQTVQEDDTRSLKSWVSDSQCREVRAASASSEPPPASGWLADQLVKQLSVDESGLSWREGDTVTHTSSGKSRPPRLRPENFSFDNLPFEKYEIYDTEIIEIQHSPPRGSSAAASSGQQQQQPPEPDEVHQRVAWADQDDGEEEAPDWSPDGGASERLATKLSESNEPPPWEPGTEPREPALEGKTTLTSMGWGHKFYKYLGMNELQAPDLMDLVTVDFSIQETDIRYMTLLTRLHAEMCANGPPAPTEEQLWDVVVAIRYTLRNLVRRRRDVLAQEQRTLGLPDVSLASHVLTDEKVEHYMRQHRQAFENCHAQRIMKAWDREQGVPCRQRDNRMSSRFSTMLLEHYGGRRCIRRYMQDGSLDEFCCKVMELGLNEQRGEEASDVVVNTAGGQNRERKPILPQKLKVPPLRPYQKDMSRARYLTKLLKDISDPTTSRRTTLFLQAKQDPKLQDQLRKRRDACLAMAKARRAEQPPSRRLPLAATGPPARPPPLAGPRPPNCPPPEWLRNQPRERSPQTPPWREKEQWQGSGRGWHWDHQKQQWAWQSKVDDEDF